MSPVRNPTPNDPGLRVYAPAADERAPGYPTSPSWLEVSNTAPDGPGDIPNAAYACRCGKTAHARGTTSVRALTADYTNHKKACPPKRRR